MRRFQGSSGGLLDVLMITEKVQHVHLTVLLVNEEVVVVLVLVVIKEVVGVLRITEHVLSKLT